MNNHHPSITARRNSLEQLTGKDFETVESRAGKIVEVEDFPEAPKPAYQRMVNFPRKRIATFSCEVLRPGFYLPSGEAVGLHPERKVPNGRKRG